MQQVVTTPAIEAHLHDCDWPAQKQLINYKLDQAITQATAINSRLDTVISNQAQAAGTDKYKKNFYPMIINVGMFVVAISGLALAFFRHAGP